MSQRALITGVSGFAGGFLAQHLLEVGDVVAGCSPDGKWPAGTPAALRDGVEMIPWDLTWPDGLPEGSYRQIERFQPDVLYHLAALSVPEDCGTHQPTAEATAINVAGTSQALELALSLPSAPRVLFVSSSKVYAPVARDAPRIDEDAPTGPTGGYALTKLLAEREVREAIDQHGCEAMIVRAFQHAGPRQDPRMMLSEWARQFAWRTSGAVKIYTTDAQIDLTDVRDVVRAYRLLAERGRAGEIYNVGSGRARRSGEVLQVLQQVAGPKRLIVETRPGFKQDPIADITRLVHATGWQAKIALKRTVSDTFRWWCQQRPPSGKTPPSGKV